MRARPGYTLTEVGEIPEDWEVKPLGEVAQICMCKRIFFAQTAINGDIPFYKIGTFGKQADAYISRDIYEKYKSKYSYPEKDDVLLSAAGTLGRTVIYNGSPAYFQDSNIVWLKIDKNQICNEYLYHYYQIIQWASPEGSTISRLYNSIILETVIKLPTTTEQTAIAAALSDVDALIDALEQSIAKKRNIKQGAMQELLTGKRRLPGFTGEWEEKRLGEIAIFQKGKWLPKSALSPNGSEPCIHYGELFTQYKETICEIISKTDNTSSTFRSVINDVLMPTSDVTPNGLAKASCILIEGVILGGDILVIRTNPKQSSGIFLSYVIRYEEKQILSLVRGSTVFHLYGEDMKNFTFKCPTLEEQTAIAAVLTDMDNAIAALEAKLAKARQIKAGMMHQLLTGRIRLL